MVKNDLQLKCDICKVEQAIHVIGNKETCAYLICKKCFKERK